MRRSSPRQCGHLARVSAALLLIGGLAAACSSDEPSSSATDGPATTTSPTTSSTTGSAGSTSGSTTGADLFCESDAAESIDGIGTVLLDDGSSIPAPFISGNAYNDPDFGLQILLSTVELAPCSGSQASASEVGEHRVFAVVEIVDGEPVLGLSYAVYNGSSTTGVGETLSDATITFDCPLSVEALAGEIPIGATISGSFEGMGGEVGGFADFSLTYCGDEREPPSDTQGGSSGTGDYTSTGSTGTGDYTSTGTGDYTSTGYTGTGGYTSTGE